MPYELKYKVGETLETNGNGEGRDHEGYHVIVVGSWNLLTKYSSEVEERASYDERDEFHILYSTFEIESGRFWWYYENDLIPYCSNLNRGKKMLLSKVDSIRSSYNISLEKWNQYVKDFLLISEDENSPNY